MIQKILTPYTSVDYAGSVAEKEATEFGDSIYLRRTTATRRIFFVHTTLCPLWAAVVGIPSGMPGSVGTGSPTPPFAALPFGDGSGLTATYGGSHAKH
jgi:hypothetical protein